MRNFLEYLKDNYQGKNVAIVSHRAPQLALDVILKGKTWEQAINEDWRKVGEWQAGWIYMY
jgi:alpha-ribazole phosphatase/probable phosphoglycerate mutase